MADISIKKLNESFVEISTSEDISYNIYSKYSEYVAGYQFSPRYKTLRIWDRKASCFQYANRHYAHWTNERLVVMVQVPGQYF